MKFGKVGIDGWKVSYVIGIKAVMKSVAMRMKQGAVVRHMELGSLVAASVLYMLGGSSGHRVFEFIADVSPWRTHNRFLCSEKSEISHIITGTVQHLRLIVPWIRVQTSETR